MWLLESRQFQSWIDSQQSISLFCPGIPGAGKTVMASIAVEYLIKKFPSNKFPDHKTGVGFVYCNYNMHETQQGIDLVSAVLKQLLEQVPQAPENFKPWHSNHTKHKTQPLVGEITDMLLLLSKSYSQIFLVVDALDECRDEPRRTLLSTIRTMQRQCHVNLMATSRPITHITNEFDKDIILAIDASNDDIDRYLDGQVPRLPDSLSKNSTLVQDIKSKVIECAAGM
jgi:Cdc6-like AAA superfamily ATPase